MTKRLQHARGRRRLLPRGTGGSSSRRRQEEQELGIYEAIVTSSDDAIVSKTLDGIITSWNRAAEYLFGYTAQEAIGKHITLIIPKELYPEEEEIIRKLRQGIRIQHFETVRLRKNGTRVEVSLSISPVQDRAGNIVGAAKIARDISERKRIEAQERFLTEASKVLATTLDHQQTLANMARLVVPQFADWFSVDLLDADGQIGLVELAHQDSEQARRARARRERYPIDSAAPYGVAHVMRTGQAELHTEITDEQLVLQARNEEELALLRQGGYTSAMLVPLRARGKTIGVASFVLTQVHRRYDARDLVLAEEIGRRVDMALDNARLYRAAQQSRDQLKIILQGVVDGILLYTSDSRIMYANEAAAQMMGYCSVQEVLQTQQDGLLSKYEIFDEAGQPIPPTQLTHLRVFAGEPEAQALIGSRLAEGDQSEYWSLVTSRPVSDDDGEVVLVVTIIHDITERIKLERRKDEFISMASHELKTPVTSLKGFTNVLQRRLNKQGDEQGLHYLARMDNQLNRLTALISELLDISRMQSGKLLLRTEPVDFDALIDEIVENVQAATLTHRLCIEGRTGVQVRGDQEHLGQVLINLLTNAIKYSPRAEKVIVRLMRDEDGEQAMVSVQDFGIGIDKAHHERIFERFYQVSNPEEKTYPGLGIGLYISNEIVARHHGRMWVESSKGKGATFVVVLPCLRSNEQAQIIRRER